MDGRQTVISVQSTSSTSNRTETRVGLCTHRPDSTPCEFPSLGEVVPTNFASLPILRTQSSVPCKAPNQCLRFAHQSHAFVLLYVQRQHNARERARPPTTTTPSTLKPYNTGNQNTRGSLPPMPAVRTYPLQADLRYSSVVSVGMDLRCWSGCACFYLYKLQITTFSYWWVIATLPQYFVYHTTSTASWRA